MPPFHPVPTSDRAGARSGVGHEERFPSPSLSGRCRLGEATFAGMGGKEEDAPIPDLRRVPINWPRRSTRPCHSLSRAPSPTGLKIGRAEFCHQTRRLRDAKVCVVWEAVPRCEKQSFSANTIGDWNRWLHHCAPPAVSNRFGSLVHTGTRPDQQPKRKQASDHSQAAG